MWQRESASATDRSILRSLSVVSEARRVKSAWDQRRSDGVNLRRSLRRLQCAPPDLTEDERLKIYKALDESLRTEMDLKELLVLLPESQGGILCLALGLLNRSENVRALTVSILQRLESIPSTRAAVNQLNFFLQSSYTRQSHK